MEDTQEPFTVIIPVSLSLNIVFQSLLLFHLLLFGVNICNALNQLVKCHPASLSAELIFSTLTDGLP